MNASQIQWYDEDILSFFRGKKKLSLPSQAKILKVYIQIQYGYSSGIRIPPQQEISSQRTLSLQSVRSQFEGSGEESRK